jgi:transcriptional regulator with XRE-family HTH domain
MLPSIVAVDQVWRCSAAGGDEAFLEARSQALEVASRTALLEILASRGPGVPSYQRTGLHTADVRVLLRWLGSLGSWSREELAARSGLSRQILWQYKTGEYPVRRAILRRLANGASLPLWLVEGLMLRTITAVRLVSEYPHPNQLLAGWRRALAVAFASPERPISVEREGNPLLLPPTPSGR